MPQSKVSRRDFLKKSIKTTASLAVLRGVTFLARPRWNTCVEEIKGIQQAQLLTYLRLSGI
jgi:hypothetical protein